jgi:hypothetical protein
MIAGGLLSKDKAKCLGVVAPKAISPKTANAADFADGIFSFGMLILKPLPASCARPLYNFRQTINNKEND